MYWALNPLGVRLSADKCTKFINDEISREIGRSFENMIFGGVSTRIPAQGDRVSIKAKKLLLIGVKT